MMGCGPQSSAFLHTGILHGCLGNLEMKDPQRVALENLARELSDISQRSRSNLRITPGESDKLFDVTVIGVINVRHQLIVTAPTTVDGKLIAVYRGLSLTCNWVSPACAFRFAATIIKIVFEPIPLLHLELTENITRREVRTLPRALVNLHAVIRTPALFTTLIVDLSVGGCRIAVAEDVELDKGEELELIAKPHMLGREFLLTLKCKITGAIDAGKQGQHGIRYYGLKFEDLSDLDLLTLHAYVQECLTLELDVLNHALNEMLMHSAENKKPR